MQGDPMSDHPVPGSRSSGAGDGLAAIAELMSADPGLRSVTHDSRAVTPGALYACLRGEQFDGHDFARAAVDAGASALLVDHELGGVGDVAQIVVDDTRLRVGPIAAAVTGHPSRALTSVGITGTNGKTTTTAMMTAIFEEAGLPCGVVGTLHGPRTTPEAPELQHTLRSFVDDGRRAAVLEVSSHALALHRVDGTDFDAVVFTNLGHDHFDLHGSQEEYFRAKARLFDPGFAPVGVINADDPYGRLIADAADDDFRVVHYSVGDLTDVDVRADSHRYTWRGQLVEVPIGGDFNVSNSLAALTTAVELGIAADVAADGLARLDTVPGRFEVIDSDAARARGLTVVVDYAHTPDGLASVLDSARRHVDVGGALVVVFGCGGRRDRPKRPQMGAVATAKADRIVITSDNPRTEDPQLIIDEILAGVDPSDRERVTTITDRRDAIADAIGSARHGDVVVIAGKGHERTQELADEVVEFDDRAVAASVLEATS
jgi:UDP-N-acetylmuramoyl-L-alanyl-D-glutamate--2,6-diaminopimelate ligase